jgi:glycerol-3-phosphate acyltransferase PlsX
MRIAVDVMGGDHGCGVVMDGVKLALQSNARIAELYVVGHKEEIEAALQRNRCRDPRLRIIHASEVLTMADKPLAALRRKKDCSIIRAIELVRDGRAESVISAGNTGGLVAASSLILRRLDGVERPAIAAIMPTARSEFVLIDAGASPDCRPVHLLQFAIMGSLYSSVMLGHRNPSVGILSNGTEEFKGTEATRQALPLVRQTGLNFLGHIEGHDVFSGQVDVVVADGFVGNIVLKTAESLGKCVIDVLKSELTANPLRQLGATLSSGALKNIKRRMDPEAYGGAPVLGLNGNVFKIHGSARARVVMNVIRQATEAAQHHLNRQIVETVTAATRRLAVDRLISTAVAPALA